MAESILIVDDTPASLRLLSQMLDESGYLVRPVLDGTQALRAAHAEEPDLILLDIRMPEMNGYEVCARLKASPATRDIPVIFISALDEIQDKVQAFASGGVDYVTKPYQLEEVLARVKAHLALRRLQRSLEDANQRMQQELTLAGEIQSGLLPNPLPDLPGWQISAALQPARETSGDFYDLIPLPDGNLGILIADVVDKGVKAALFMALSWTLIRTYACEFPGRPAAVLEAVNSRLVNDTRSGQFVSAFLGFLDPRSGQLVYCNAGHNPPFIVHDTDSIRDLKGTGMVLGLFEDRIWREGRELLEPGDILLLYTDGATDAIDEMTQEFGLTRLLGAVQSRGSTSAWTIQEALLSDIQQFVGDADQFDDIALMVIARDR